MTAEMPSTGALPVTTILIVPFSELGTKSAASRKKLMDQLLTNIKHVLKDVFSISWSKFRVLEERLVFAFKESDMPRAIFALQHVPGILRLHSCVETQCNPATITKKAEALLERGQLQVDPDQVDIRALYFSDPSQKRQMIDQVASGLNALASRHQGLDRASMPIHVELHGSTGFAYISLEQHAGMNGNPVGSENPLVTEIIGRPGDLVASVLAIKRGIVVTPVFFSIGNNAIDPGTYKSLLKYISDTIGLFHGFPVKKAFFVQLETIQTLLIEQFPDLMDQDPCSCCILSRNHIVARIVEDQQMVPFVIQGLGPFASDDLATCPLAGYIDSHLNPDNLLIATPILTKNQAWPEIFAQHFASCPVDSDESEGYSWSFCRLWKIPPTSKLEQESIMSVIKFLDDQVFKNSAFLIRQIDDEFDFNE